MLLLRLAFPRRIAVEEIFAHELLDLLGGSLFPEVVLSGLDNEFTEHVAKQGLHFEDLL